MVPAFIHAQNVDKDALIFDDQIEKAGIAFPDAILRGTDLSWISKLWHLVRPGFSFCMSGNDGWTL